MLSVSLIINMELRAFHNLSNDQIYQFKLKFFPTVHTLTGWESKSEIPLKMAAECIYFFEQSIVTLQLSH